jgi:hypothetical protein
LLCSSISTEQGYDDDNIPELLPRDYDSDLDVLEDDFYPPEGFIESDNDSDDDLDDDLSDDLESGDNVDDNDASDEEGLKEGKFIMN